MERAAKPPRLTLVRDFVNTLDVEDGVDALERPGALGRWLAEHGLVLPRARVAAADVKRARDLREALRALLLANNGIETDMPAARSALDDVARRAGLTVCFEPGVAFEPTAGGVDGALGRLVAAVAEAMLADTWPRLKACREGTCTWAFWDGSRNRSRTWCSMAVCGNRTKARAYRRRRAA